ncbi:oligopeptide/dipeptide ABC transporter ATP-binding protein [Leeia oryzae]|uniref:oligopeptide/dipeptide ABC transporter ATP-binding protein n=1 Tax=Leeia oryzae TaxID=356662 RepID=UPI0003782168|nr:ABC transporter ATP-binding protein [Leeia oryzae]
MTTMPVLSLKDIQVRFPVNPDWRGRPRQHVHALNGISLEIAKGETLGIVGESGCGKSTMAQVLIGLLQPTQGEMTLSSGKSNGKGGMQIVFQDPQSSLNPRLPVWKIITEPVFAAANRKVDKAAMRELAQQLAAQVGIRPEYIDRFPHEFSGGQRQRIAIARALAAEPDIIVLDEPTSALDISVQAQILNLLAELQRSRQLTFILISHNVSVVRHMCNRVAVMYLGQIVEIGDAAQVLEHPAHPYTQLLLASVPTLESVQDESAVPENVELPSNRVLPTGCYFKDRCPSASSACLQPQVLKQISTQSQEHEARCHLAHPD